MTITKVQSTPLIAVVGATGVQGRGSVIKALSESDKPYRIRGFTRDVAKPAAEALKKRGVELVAVNLVLENKEKCTRLTNYWEHMDLEREVSEGKLLIEAAKAAGVKGIIWSGLVPVKKISGGKYTKVNHFDGKAQVTEYGRASGVPFVDVQAGSARRHLCAAVGRKTHTVMPTIDMENDYGLYVRWVLEMPVFPDGLDVYTTSEDISLEDQARQISEGKYCCGACTGKKVVFKQITPEEATQRFVSLGFPPAAATDVVEGYQFFDEFGYYGGNPSTSAKGLARPTRTFAEFVRSADWSTVLA
ncbi:NAD(P)-binding protein [Mycena olivaceomarginata]|nr:NAD(P)-binding protein [Mycena olivaceomarginata]